MKDEEAQLDDFVIALISGHGSRLKRFSLHRLPISLEALYDVCTGFVNLEQLFIVVEQEDLVGFWIRACHGVTLTSLRSSSGTHYRKPPDSRRSILIF